MELFIKKCGYDKCGVEFTTPYASKKYCCAQHRLNVNMRNWRHSKPVEIEIEIINSDEEMLRITQTEFETHGVSIRDEKTNL